MKQAPFGQGIDATLELERIIDDADGDQAFMELEFPTLAGYFDTHAYLNLCAFRSSGLVLAGLTLALLMGCAVRRPIGMTFEVAPGCLLSPVELVGCDAGSPPRCKTARVSYRRGCETLQPAR